MRVFSVSGRRWLRGTDRGTGEDRGRADSEANGGSYGTSRGTYRTGHRAGCACTRCARARALKLEVFRDQTPILATRVARVRLGGREPFGAINSGDCWFGVTARARCKIKTDTYHRARRGKHSRTVPDPTCTCGFYSVTADRYYGVEGSVISVVRLDVLLAGRVILCQTGYRAGWQRVLGVRVPACACGARRDALKFERRTQTLQFGHASCLRSDRWSGYWGSYLDARRVPPELFQAQLPVPVTFEGKA